jgi:hypothetical protein
MTFWDGSHWVADVPARHSRAHGIARRMLGATAEAGLITVLIFGLIAGSAFAGKGSHSGGGGGSCVANTPGLAVQNTWAWAQTGSYGLAGQRLTYQVQVINYDVGCRSASFVLSASAPAGFAVSVPTNTITVKAGGIGYLSAYVTSPAGSTDGTYPVTFNVLRTGTASPAGAATTYYMVYSSDSAAPSIYWPNPSEGQTVTGRSFWVQASATDDHSVKEISVSIDSAALVSTQCDDIAYSCTLYYNWTTVRGTHTATFTATDWMGNDAATSVRFTVN